MRAGPGASKPPAYPYDINIHLINFFRWAKKGLHIDLPMENEYTSESVKKLFNSFGLMNKKIGMDMTRTIKKRFDQLKAAPNFSVFLSLGLGKPHPLTGDLKKHVTDRVNKRR